MEETAPETGPGSAAEARSFRKIMNAFRTYKTHMHHRVNKCTRSLKRMSENHRRYLRKYAEHLDSLKIYVEVNSTFLEDIAANTRIFENQDFEHVGNGSAAEETPTSMDMDKVVSTLRQLRREWSADGESERNQCFLPLLERAEKFFPGDRSGVSVLVPGAGLGRLPFEFASRGFCSQGNEFSYHMLSVSFYILNKSEEVDQFKIYPHLKHFSNNFRNEDQIRGVTIPDVLPCSKVTNDNFSMSAGDFTEVFANQDERWDIVATCFFIDTAHNIVEYIELIHRILKPGGYWLNLGPLLYHHEDMPNVDSIEPSFEDVKNISKAMGFEIIEEQTDLETHYCGTPGSMLEYVYRSVLLVCRKPSPAPSSNGTVLSSSRGSNGSRVPAL